MSDNDKTVTEIYMKAGFAQTRGYGAATSRGWHGTKETEAFMDGARWMLEQVRLSFDLKPKIELPPIGNTNER
jgi:hypothetical protein